MTCEEYIPEGWTPEELQRVQENLSEPDFDIFLRQLKAFHGLQIGDVISNDDTYLYRNID